MRRNNCRVSALVLLLSMLALSLSSAQEPAARPTQDKPNQPPTVSIATLTARLIDAETKAKQQAATVEATVSGLELIDPAQVNELARAGQGHLHYQVDDGLVIATTTTKLSFRKLARGSHKIVVLLAGNDHRPLGPTQTLNVVTP